MAIRRRGKKSWEVCVELGHDPLTDKRRRAVQNVKGTRRDALLVQTQLSAQRDTGIDLEPSRLTLAAYLDRWLASIRPDIAPATYTRYEGIVRVQIKPHLGAISLTKLRPLHVQEFYARLRRSGRVNGGPLAARTVLHTHRVLSTALNRALQTQLIGRNVCEAVRAPQAQRPELRVFGGDETRALLTAAEAADSVCASVIAMAVHTGMRQGELLGLRWKAVDLERTVITVRTTLQRDRGGGFSFREPKTSRSRRSIPVGGAGVDVLRRVRARQLRERLAAGRAWKDADLVFASATGAPLTVKALQHAFHQLLRANGLPRIRFHDLRHTHASLLLLRGANPKVVSERLGHTTVAFTLDTYSHLLPGLQEDAARDLDAWLRSSS